MCTVGQVKSSDCLTGNEPNSSQVYIVCIIKQAEGGVSHEAVESLLQKFAIQDFIRLDHTESTGTSVICVDSSLKCI